MLGDPKRKTIPCWDKHTSNYNRQAGSESLQRNCILLFILIENSWMLVSDSVLSLFWYVLVKVQSESGSRHKWNWKRANSLTSVVAVLWAKQPPALEVWVWPPLQKDHPSWSCCLLIPSHGGTRGITRLSLEYPIVLYILLSETNCMWSWDGARVHRWVGGAT